MIFRKWYEITKSDINADTLSQIKSNLIIYPKQEDAEPMMLYREDDDTLSVPFKWGSEFFGVPTFDCCEGNDVKYHHFPDPFHEKAPENQAEFMDEMLAAYHSQNMFLVKAGTGTGKTVCGLNTIARAGKQGLIVVPTDRLTRQWIAEVKDKLKLKDSQIGLVKQDMCDYKNKHIVIASMQSLECREYEADFYTHFGVIVYDELHTLNATKMSDILGKFNALKQIGMTATPKRRDGRDKVTQWWFGAPYVNADKMKPQPITITPFEYHHTIYIPPEVPAIQYLANDQNRSNKLSEIMNFLYKEGRVQLGIGDSIKQLQFIKDRLIKGYDVPEEDVCIFADQIYTGEKRLTIIVTDKMDIDNLKKEKEDIAYQFDDIFSIRPSTRSISVTGEGVKYSNKRSNLLNALAVSLGVTRNDLLVRVLDHKKKIKTEDIDAMLTNKNMKIYLASYGVMKMGIDVPWLDCGMDLTPRVEAIQVIGRVRRKGDHKPQARWYTPMDVGVTGMITGINNARLRDYKTSDNVTLRAIRRT